MPTADTATVVTWVKKEKRVKGRQKTKPGTEDKDQDRAISGEREDRFLECETR